MEDDGLKRVPPVEKLEPFLGELAGAIEQGRQTRNAANAALKLTGAAKSQRKLADATRQFPIGMRQSARGLRRTPSHPVKQIPEHLRVNRWDYGPKQPEQPNPRRGVQPSDRIRRVFRASR